MIHTKHCFIEDSTPLSNWVHLDLFAVPKFLVRLYLHLQVLLQLENKRELPFMQFQQDNVHRILTTVVVVIVHIDSILLSLDNVVSTGSRECQTLVRLATRT